MTQKYVYTLLYCLFMTHQLVMAQVLYNQHKLVSDSLLHHDLQARKFTVSYFDSRFHNDVSESKIPIRQTPAFDISYLRIADSLISSTAVGTSQHSDDRLRTVPAIPPVRLISWRSHRISSRFGWRVHPIRGTRQQHTGIDLPSPGGTPVYATADGTVQQVFWNKDGLGLTIRIKHPSSYESVYGHLSAYSVRQGDVVRRGGVIGRVGSTGRSTGPHLHYAILYQGNLVDPERYYLLWMRHNTMLSDR